MREPSPPERLESMIRALEQTGMGPTAIAREADVGRTTVWRFINGDTRMPSFEVFTRIETLYRQRVPR